MFRDVVEDVGFHVWSISPVEHNFLFFVMQWFRLGLLDHFIAPGRTYHTWLTSIQTETHPMVRYVTSLTRDFSPQRAGIIVDFSRISRLSSTRAHETFFVVSCAAC